MSAKKLNPPGYTITYEPIFVKEGEEGVTEKLAPLSERCHHIAERGNPSGLKHLLKTIKTYPQVPQFKNYLSMWYKRRGNIDKSYEINRQIVKEHPDYFFGKINLAHEFLQNGDLEKIPELLGDQLDIKQLYPQRDIFHITEVMAILQISIIYFIEIKDLEQASIRYELLEEIAPDEDATLYCQEILFFARLKQLPEERSTYGIQTKPQPTTTKTEAPKFTHSQINILYHHTALNQSQIESLLALPRETLIQDLETILKDSIERYSFFEKNNSPKESNFLIHALFLLQELKAEESLDQVLEIFKQSTEYLDLYLMDILTEYGWQIIFTLAVNRLETLKSFMKLPFLNIFSKLQMSQAVAQMALYYPEKRMEVVNWFAELFKFYESYYEEERIVDDSLIGFVICDVLDLGGKELSESIQKLFDKDFVDPMICGDWEKVKSSLDKDVQVNKYKILNLAGIQDVLNSVEEEFEYDDSEEDYVPLQLPIKKEINIGRNDPCLCGSGKKYKKCCLN